MLPFCTIVEGHGAREHCHTLMPNISYIVTNIYICILSTPQSAMYCVLLVSYFNSIDLKLILC